MSAVKEKDLTENDFNKLVAGYLKDRLRPILEELEHLSNPCWEKKTGVPHLSDFIGRSLQLLKQADGMIGREI